ncbi:MAG: hypothetical protein HYS80_00910 [Candidatus Aenigmarchaeota archaeon]|nr:hypothetical protein [Candidatus Aenigmarchaeota archaeon]
MSNRKGNEDISLKQERFVSGLTEVRPETQQYYESLPPSIQQRLRSHRNSLKHGITAIAPLVCMGPSSCPFINACPIPSRSDDGSMEYGPISNYPNGLPCVLEQETLANFVAGYIYSLDVDPQDPVEMSMVNELAIIDLLKNRALLVLANGDKYKQGRDLLAVDIAQTFINDNGEVLTTTNTKLHPAAGYLDSLEKRRERWLDKLMVTRKAKAELAAKSGKVQAASELLEDLGRLREFIENIQAEPEKISIQKDELITID